ncbi:uncharacterized protein CBL_11131 [Carabus blaptoides fortunei]
MRANVQLLFFFVLMAASTVLGAPVTSEPSTEVDDTTENADTNATDLYVIRAIVYEVGILTEPDNTTDESEELHEQVDLTFFDPQHNGSMIDLSNIPVPLQTNVSGQVVTGLAPVNLGSLQLPTSQAWSQEAPIYSPANDNLTAYALPSAIVSVTTNVSTTNPNTSSSILQGLPPLLGLPQTFNTSTH